MDLLNWQSRLQAFADERAWLPYLNPKNLVMAMSVEAAELVECYQWCPPETALALTQEEPGRSQVADEMADVLMYLLHLARETGIDLEAACEAKLAKNALKYPATGRARPPEGPHP
ncbi:NTP pyrophosphatase (non-canonical NTP hydrolase) [Inhella inkyongensis]|uniref:NTP pyrophosphatase (Non-canonical NTP hydrolase) n=1 Tax=Inhella inkyongensis TaxID=392593 RepID=A0A840S8J3_9BURK|nr:nucleotide pyrophosphohydrolase [Inhella inkyongensis]MBB5205114.1 NTP pyrophosphatase (non-canonical NTP hydrolase) [Inhella inkyongensis]